MLRDIGVPFRVVVSDVEEGLDGENAEPVAERNALLKLRAAGLPEDVGSRAFVLATDTVVAIDETLLGKPGSAEEAISMLRLLSGRTHRVVSGVALAGVRKPALLEGTESRAAVIGDVASSCAVTEVTFSRLDEAALAAYVASGEWDGKAGAYAIQGIAGLFVSGIRGEYSNVVGLPLGLLARMFREQGFDLLRREWV